MKHFIFLFWALLFLISSGLITGCQKSKEQQSAKFETIDDLVTTLKHQEGSEYTKLDFFKENDQKLFDVKNKHAHIFSIIIADSQPAIVVVFKKDNPTVNVQAFLDILDATGEELAKTYKGGTYIVYDTNLEYVMYHYGGTAEQVFLLEGIRFYENGMEVDETGNNIYKDAYTEIIKEKQNKTKLSEWDYYMFRSRFPEPEKEGSMQLGPAVLGSSALIEVIRMHDGGTFFSTIALQSRTATDILAIPEERESAKVVMEHSVYGIIWFDDEGRRVMGETLEKDKETGKIIKDRRWYNGYSGPE